MKLILALLALCLISVLVVVGSCSEGAPPYVLDEPIDLGSRMRTPEEHDAIVSHTGLTYLFRTGPIDGTGSLLLYGARHTSDRGDPQIGEIESLWKEHEPTVALMEGRRSNYFIGPLFPGIASEAEIVHELARRDDVPIYSLEPSYETEIEYLLDDGWAAERLALYFILRVYSSESGGEADENLAEHLLRKRTDVEGLRGALSTVDDLDALWQRDFAGSPDWRSWTGAPSAGYLAEIGDASRRVRGEHMARALIDLVRRGERVFAVVGSGHVIRIEPILRDAFGMDPPADLKEPGPVQGG